MSVPPAFLLLLAMKKAPPPTMAALLKFAPLSQVLFGSDHPYVSDVDNIVDLKCCGLSARDMNAILYENAERLVPQLKG